MRYLIALIFCCLISFSYSQDITIGPGGDYATLSDAQNAITAGDSVMLLNGVFSNGTQFLYDLKGTSNEPITIYAQTRHQVIFRGGTESIHLVNCEHVTIDGLVIEGQTGNGMNIDDGGDYNTPTKFITVQYCRFQNMPASGNRDFLKLSGLDSFRIHNCSFIDGGDGGSGIDMVGCHWGIIEDNIMDAAGVTGIQAKGGTHHITIRRNVFENMSQRALNLGGSTGLQFFRPPLPDPIQDAFEAADLDVYSNIFRSNWAPIAYVGCVRVRVFNNTIYHPRNWVIRILQETTVPGFLTCADNVFRNNIVIVPADLREVNIGPNTAPETFSFSNNLWFNESSNSWQPQLPVTDSMQILANPRCVDPAGGDYSLEDMSPAIGAGKFIQMGLLDHLQKTFLNPPSIGAFEGGKITTSIDPYEDLSIELFPNPALDVVKIKSNEVLGKVSIWSFTGNLLSHYDVNDKVFILNISRLPQGSYWITSAHGKQRLIKL